eukprot:SAG11_NODE_6924_length_1224_cov_1.056000_1_plen_92_part_00
MDGSERLVRFVDCFFEDWRKWYEEHVVCDLCADDEAVSSCDALHAADASCTAPLPDIDGVGSYHNTIGDACARTCGLCTTQQVQTLALASR